MNRKAGHSIDFIFPVILFFVFSLCAITAILLAANVYSETVHGASLNATSRTVLSYITEKIHQSEENGNTRTGKFNGIDAIIIDQDDCRTYIYEYQGTLYELYEKKDAHALPGSGNRIMKVNEFTIEETYGRLITVTCEDENGSSAKASVALRSR